MVSTSTETLDWCQQDQAKKRGKGGQAAGPAAGQAEGQADKVISGAVGWDIGVFPFAVWRTEGERRPAQRGCGEVDLLERRGGALPGLEDRNSRHWDLTLCC